MIVGNRLNCETIYQEMFKRVDDLFPSEESEAAISTLQILAAQISWCHVLWDDAVTVLRNVAAFALSNDYVSADERLPITKRALLVQEISFSGNLNHSPKIERRQFSGDWDLRNVINENESSKTLCDDWVSKYYSNGAI